MSIRLRSFRLHLCYDIDPQGAKLTVDEPEVMRVRAIFELYLELKSIVAVLNKLDWRGWMTKRWKIRKGPERGGNSFEKSSSHRLLTNVIYIGKVRYKEEVHAGEHAAVITDAAWKRTQTMLERNRRTGGAEFRNTFGAILMGLLRY
jgi:site-specific DNA recombinase